MQQNVRKYLLYLAVLSLFRFLVCLCIQQIQYKHLFKQACFHIISILDSQICSPTVFLRNCPLFYSMMQFAWWAQLLVFQNSFTCLQIKKLFPIAKALENFCCFIFPNAKIHVFYHQNLIQGIINCKKFKCGCFRRCQWKITTLRDNLY